MSLNQTMRAVAWEGVPLSMSVVDMPMPTLTASTDVIVRMQAAICGTDLHVYHGVYGSTESSWGMGHEGVGLVEQVGDAVTSLEVGDFVIIPDLLVSGHVELEP